jgi:hypothetical protein
MKPIADRTMLDPGSFALEITSHLGNQLDQFSNDWYAVMAPEAEAEYRQVSDRLQKIAKAHGVGLYDAVGDYGAAATGLFLEMFSAGLRQGAAYENLRRSMVRETVICMDCFGHGHERGNDKSPCTTCGETGLVAMKDGE